MSDGIGLAEALLGLDGFRVLEVAESTDELVVAVETTATIAWCAACGTRAEAHDRMPIEVRDLPCFGRPARLVWRKRRWRCREDACDARTWTERSESIAWMTGVYWLCGALDETGHVLSALMPAATAALL
jgi:transposase